MDVARLSSKGQVTIPVGIRRKLGLIAGENVIFVERSGNVIISSEQGINTSVSDGWSKEFVSAFAQFSETADDTFVEPDEIPPEYCAKRVEFE